MQYYTGNTTTTTTAAAAAAATDASMVTVAPIPSLSSGVPPLPLSSSLSPSAPSSPSARSYSIEPINYVSAVDDEMFLVDHFEGESYT